MNGCFLCIHVYRYSMDSSDSHKCTLISRSIMEAEVSDYVCGINITVVVSKTNVITTCIHYCSLRAY